jgi:hypothetical protein
MQSASTVTCLPEESDEVMHAKEEMDDVMRASEEVNADSVL